MRECTRRIFGGKEPARDDNQRALYNEADQAVAETLAVGTHRRVFPGPQGKGQPWWSYFVNVTEAGAATSAISFLYSWLPNPDPGTAAHWKDSGITPLDAAAVASYMDDFVQAAPLWIMAQAVVVTNTADVLGYVRVSGVE
jgi:hypothetical protein